MKQITDHLYQISMGGVNAFIIEDKGELTLVDTGFPGSTEKIFAAIKKGGKDPQNIKRIILTHSHPDHSGSAAEIAAQLKVPVIMHGIDAELVEQGIAGRGKILSPGILNYILYTLFIKNGKNETPAVKISERLKDGDVLPIAGGIKVMHTPGHSLGHIVLLLQQDNTLICGDICANMMGLDYSTVYEDRAIGVQSVLKATTLGFDKAVFGHGNALVGAASDKMRKHFERLS